MQQDNAVLVLVDWVALHLLPNVSFSVKICFSNVSFLFQDYGMILLNNYKVRVLIDEERAEQTKRQEKTLTCLLEALQT